MLAFRLGFTLTTLASPLLVPFEDLGKVWSEHHPESVSTELTLGTGPASASTIQTIHRPVAGTVQWGFTSDFIPDQSASQIQNSFSHSDSSHFHAFHAPAEAVPQASFHSPPSVPPAPLPSAAQAVARQNAAAERIDVQFSEFLKDPQQHNWMRLPSKVVYIRAPWLSDLHKWLSQEIKGRRSFQTDEVVVTNDVLERIMSKTSSILMPKGYAYTIHVEAGQWGSDRSRELMFRFHSKIVLDFRADIAVYNVVSFWSTADHGSKLALLGVYSLSKTAFGEMVRLPGVKEFSLWSPSRGGLKRYLKPVFENRDES